MQQLAGLVTTSCRVVYSLLMLWAFMLPVLAHAAGSDDYAASFAKAQSLAKQGNDADASKIYQALIKQDPSQPQAYNNLAAIKARHGELKQAQALLEQALRSNPVYATVYDNLSAIYVEMARDSYGKALRLETPSQAIALHDIDAPIVIAATSQTAALPAKKTEPTTKMSTVVATTDSSTEASTATSKTSAAFESKPVSKPAPDQKPEPAPSSQVTPPTAPSSATQAPVTSAIASTQPASVEQPSKATPSSTPVIAEAVAPESEVASRLDAANDPATLNNEDLVTTLQGWAAAWSEKAVDVYLSFYTDEYAPSGMTHAQWQAQRRQRLLAPKWIRVSLSDVQVKVIKGNEADVRLIQHYQADNYQDRTRKSLRLRHTVDGWRIFEENTVATLR